MQEGRRAMALSCMNISQNHECMIHWEFKLASGFVVWLGHNEKWVDGVVRNVTGEITSDQIMFVSLFKEFGFFWESNVIYSVFCWSAVIVTNIGGKETTNVGKRIGLK